MNNHDTVRGKKPFAALSKFSLAAIILMLAFFVVGASTMGVFNSPGRAYHATKSDAAYFYLDYDTNNQSGLANIYVNIGAAYTEIGKDASITMQYSTGTSSSIAWSSGTRMGARKFANVFTSSEDVPSGVNYNWVNLYNMESNTLSTSYRLIKLTVAQETIVNEVVFFDKEGKVIPAYTQLDQKIGETTLDGKLKSKYSDEQYTKVKELFRKNANDAKNLTDRQHNVSKGESWRENFTEDEMYTLMQIDNLLLGDKAEEGSVYNGDTDFGSLSALVLSLGVLIFGKSTFGLRFIPLLCTVLLIGLVYLFMRRIFRSDGYGFLSALLLAFGGMALTAGRLGLGFTLLALLLVGCYYLMYRFFEKGVDPARPVHSALNVLFSGLCFAGAFAVWANSWIVALGAVALVVLGVLKMRRKQEAQSRAVARETNRVNAEETDKEVMQANLDESERIQARQAAACAYHTRVSVVFFLAAFVFGTFLVVILSVLPAYYSYVRLYDNPAAPHMSFFALVSEMVNNTRNVSNLTSLTDANAMNAFSWLLGLKGATAFTASSDNMYVALNVQNNIAMTLSALVGFIVSTVYVIVYFAAGGKDNPEYRKSFRRIGRAYLVLTSGSFLTLLACAVVPSMSVMYGLLFYVFFTGYIPLLVYIANAHDASGKTVVCKKYEINNTMKVLFVVLAVYALIFVASLPMLFGFGVPAPLAHGLFGWTSIFNNGFYR